MTIVDFSDAKIDGHDVQGHYVDIKAVECSRCGAVLAEQSRTLHLLWHDKISPGDAPHRQREVSTVVQYEVVGQRFAEDFFRTMRGRD